MPVFRVEKNNNYTTMCNYHLRDQNLSLKAKGLLSMCLSLSDSWDYSINGLVVISKEGRDAILSTVRELEIRGYIVRGRTRDEQGRLRGASYTIYEMPQAPMTDNPMQEIPTQEMPTQEEPIQEKPAQENPLQLSTDLLSTETINKRQIKEQRHRYGEYANVLLSDAELEKLKTEFPKDYRERIERLSGYIASTGKSYKNHLATIRNWAQKEQPRYRRDNYHYEEGDSL